MLRCLVVDVLDLVDNGESARSAQAMLREVLVDPARDDQAWGELVKIGGQLAANHGEGVVLLTAEGLGATAGAARADLGLRLALDTVLRDWTGKGRATLLVDGLDAARGESLGWLCNLVEGLEGSRWRQVFGGQHCRHRS